MTTKRRQIPPIYRGGGLHRVMEILSAGPATREQLIEAGVPLPTINQALRTLRESGGAARCCSSRRRGWMRSRRCMAGRTTTAQAASASRAARPGAIAGDRAAYGGGAVALKPDSTVDNLNIAPRNHGYLQTRRRLHNPSFRRDACKQARP